MTYESLDSIVTSWLGCQRDRYDERTLNIGKNHIDMLGLSGTFLGTAAIHFNKVVLLSKSVKFPGENMPERIGELARAKGYDTLYLTAKQMTELRSCLPIFDHELDKAMRFRLLLRDHRDLFPRLDHPRCVINFARMKNALYYAGEMTHGCVRLSPEEKLFMWFRDAEDAVHFLMTRDTPSNFQLVEIGG